MARSLTAILTRLEQAYGRPAPPLTRPLDLIWWENVAYLVPDERRAKAFAALARIGLTARAVARAPEAALLAVATLGGMRPQDRVAKLRQIAAIAEELGDLDAVVAGPPAAARKALRRFPGIGEPGAEKILMFAGRAGPLALESNGLRVLVRLGFGSQHKSYSVMYKSAQAAVGAVAEPVRAHELLKRHGKEVCKATPRCEICPVQRDCAYFARMG